MRSSLPALVATAALGFSASACSLIPIEATADGKLQFEIDGTDNTYLDIVTYDPNENEDYMRYKDEFERGQIDSIQIKVLRLRSENEATWAAGQVDVRPSGAGDDAWVEGVSEWNGLRLQGDLRPDGTREELRDEIFLNPATFENYDELNKVVFQGDRGPIDLRVQGITDQGPVKFDLEVTVTFTVAN